MACFRRYCEKITSAAIMGRPSCSRIGTDMGHMLCLLSSGQMSQARWAHVDVLRFTCSSWVVRHVLIAI